LKRNIVQNWLQQIVGIHIFKRSCNKIGMGH